jgi:FkbM family methyltransferase
MALRIDLLARRRLASFVTRHLARSAVAEISLKAAVAATSRKPRLSALGKAGLHLRSAFVDNPRLALARTCRGSVMVVDLGDWRHHELLARGVYELHLTALFSRIASPGWTFLDVGANVGYFSVLACELGGPTAGVHAFEPHPRMAALAEVNARLTPGLSYTVVQAACGARPGQALLHLASTPGNIGDSTLLHSGGHRGPAVAVRVVTLDDHCETAALSPDVIKVDVEGSEGGVIAGMSRLLSDQVPSHVVVELGEIEERPVPELAIAQLAQFGYAPRSITAAGHLVDYVPDHELQDVCFVRSTVTRPDRTRRPR